MTYQFKLKLKTKVTVYGGIAKFLSMFHFNLRLRN